MSQIKFHALKVDEIVKSLQTVIPDLIRGHSGLLKQLDERYGER